MDRAGFNGFRALVLRKGKAMRATSEIRNTFRKQYEEIVRGLNEGYKEYIIYLVTDGANAYVPGMETIADAGNWDEIRRAITEGNLDELDRQCGFLKEFIRRTKA